MPLFVLVFLLALCTLAQFNSYVNSIWEPAGAHTAIDDTTTSSYPTSLQPPYFSNRELELLTRTMMDNYMYPANIAQAQAINSSFLSPSIIGRVDVTSTLYGQELNTEYLFGLFTQLAQSGNDSFSLLGVPTSYQISHFVGKKNVAACTVIIHFNFTAINTVLPIEIDTWTIFNAQRQVQQYDITFRWFEYFLETLLGLLQPLVGTTSPSQTIQFVQQKLAKSICGLHNQYCNGTNTQYDSYDSCMEFLTQKIRFGQAWEMGRDTLLCRMVHQNMLVYRPDVHCPHIGPSGGNMCVDSDTYVGRVLQNDFIGGSFLVQ
jgi:hypothetical protein